MTTEIEISGMNCQHCVAAVTRALEAVPGVTAVAVDLAAGRARVDGAADPGSLERAVIDAGYQGRALTPD
jgi:copper chaperone CopZ